MKNSSVFRQSFANSQFTFKDSIIQIYQHIFKRYWNSNLYLNAINYLIYFMFKKKRHITKFTDNIPCFICENLKNKTKKNENQTMCLLMCIKSIISSISTTKYSMECVSVFCLWCYYEKRICVEESNNKLNCARVFVFKCVLCFLLLSMMFAFKSCV